VVESKDRTIVPIERTDQPQIDKVAARFE